MIVGTNKLATYLAKKGCKIYVDFLIIDEVHKNLGTAEKIASTQIGVMLKKWLRAKKVIGLSGTCSFLYFLQTSLQLSQLLGLSGLS